MDIHTTPPLLGGLSPAAIHEAALAEEAAAGARRRCPACSRCWRARELFALAARDDVESRLVARDGGAAGRMRRGPVRAARAAAAARSRAGRCWCRAWTCTTTRAHALLQQFRFVPEARLDDLMISYASDGGGVGPHFDSYDVFLLQAQGRRRWRIGRQQRPDAAARACR